VVVISLFENRVERDIGPLALEACGNPVQRPPVDIRMKNPTILQAKQDDPIGAPRLKVAAPDVVLPSGVLLHCELPNR
jgi:hypothetical protein